MRRVASAQVRAARQQYRFRHTGKTVDQRDSDGKLIAPSLKKKPMTDRKDSAGSKKNCTTRSSSKPRSAAGASISKPPKSQPEPEPMSKTEMDSLAVEETLPDDRADAGDADDAGAKKPAKSHIKVERQKTDPAIKKKISFRESHERSASLRVRPVKKATSSSPSPSPSSLGSESSLGDEEEAAAALMNSEVSESGHGVDISCVGVIVRDERV
uniref:Uncharacterized protein n=1 Tax=Plectus sambesii TaxID=2011161 RepID=A0A914W354_9BILA